MNEPICLDTVTPNLLLMLIYVTSCYFMLLLLASCCPFANVSQIPDGSGLIKMAVLKQYVEMIFFYHFYGKPRHRRECIFNNGLHYRNQ